MYNSAFTAVKGDQGVQGPAGAQGLSQSAVIQDQKAQNTDGGTFTSGAWRTRDLNTVVSDPSGIVSLSANRFTLQAGTYLIRAVAPAFHCDQHQARLQNITDATTTLVGTNGFVSSAANYAVTHSVVEGIFVITGAKAFEIQHQCITTQGTNGFGAKVNLTTEVYTSVTITKIA